MHPPALDRRDDRPHRTPQAVRKAGADHARAWPARAGLRRGATELLPWIFDLEDKRFNVQMRRRILLALFAAEGAGIGASLGAQAGPPNPAYLGLGAGVGLLTGIGYASLMPGREASLEPGDTFRITVGTLSYRPLAPSPPLSLHPAPTRRSARRSTADEAGPAASSPSPSGRCWRSPDATGGRPAPEGDLPPAYTRDKILEPKLAEAARAFIAWAGKQQVKSQPVFGKVEVLPPAPTLLPYGVGTYQKQLRLPAILITGPGWRALTGDDREAAGCPSVSGAFPIVGIERRTVRNSRRPSRSRRPRVWSCAGSMNWSRGGSSCMANTSERPRSGSIARGALPACWRCALRSR